MKRFLHVIVFGAMLLSSGVASADTSFEAIPNAWRLQNYVGGQVTAFYTASTCSSGQINLANTISENDRNRFWSMIMTAKTLNRAVGIFYETTSGNCNITSFYLP